MFNNESVPKKSEEIKNLKELIQDLNTAQNNGVNTPELGDQLAGLLLRLEDLQK